MNIKNMALFSVIFVASTQAQTLADKLDQAKKELNECRQSKLPSDCATEKEIFLGAKKEFLAPLRKNIIEVEKAFTKFAQEIEDAEKYFYFKRKTKEEAAWNNH